METEQPTERTPLIEQHNTQSTNTSADPLPFIVELEKDIYSDSEYPAVHRIIERKVDGLAHSPSTALTLKLLLSLRFLSGSYFQLDRDTWLDSRSVEEDVSLLSTQSWADLRRIAWSQAALDETLWTQFHLEREKETQIYLIEAVLADQTHGLSSIQLDDRIALSLLRTWKSGRPRSVYDHRPSTLLARIESFATPRVLHLVDLVFNLAYLFILIHYLTRPSPVYPANPPVPNYHVFCMAVYAVSRILRKRYSPTHGTFLLTLVTTLSVLPSVPRQRDNSYNILIFCFFIHVLQLLLPFPPTLSLLSIRSASFAASSILSNLFALVFNPAIAFFIPIIFALLFILLASLGDIFVTISGLFTFDIFLVTVWCSALFFTFLTSYMTLSSSSLPLPRVHHPSVPTSWNSYGPNASISLRRHLCRLTIEYSSPYFFPAPLNLIPLILVHLPRLVLRAFGEKHVAPYLRSTVEPVIWRVLIIPLAFVFGITWLWK